MKAVIYARYSSDSQREESIEGQLRECLEYAEKNGTTVIANYIDRAMTATIGITLMVFPPFGFTPPKNNLSVYSWHCYEI